MKVGIISQARMTSTRLPGKVLKEVNGIPLLKYHIDRAMQSGYQLYIATTTNATDEPIVDFCKKENIPYYRGSEDHVLSRYYGCAKENELDIVVRITSDCPLVDGALIKKEIEAYIQKGNKNLYASIGLSQTYPRGFDFEIFSFHLLHLAFKNAQSPAEIEHVTPYLYLDKNPIITKEAITYSQKKNHYRITVDTPEDFMLVEQLIANYNAHHLTVDEIVAVLDQNPALVEINAHIEQKKLNEK